MSIILHLSDLHLSSQPTDDQVIGDHKVGILRPEERKQRTDLLRKTLAELGKRLKDDGQKLGAVAVSGDITVAYKEDGFQQLPNLLSELGEAHPGAERVVVVPGNHDVKWGTSGGSSERYQYFLSNCRAKGYITPLLDGVDKDISFNADTVKRHLLVDPDAGWIIIPVNSSNYCGTIESTEGYPEDFWEKLPALVKKDMPGLNEADFGKKLRGLRLHDVARVSEWQMDSLQKLIRAVGQTGEGLLRIATLHHHLLPVSTSEEIKTFESIINLGSLRKFLSEQRVSVVLHGHKHKGYVYQDHMYPEDGKQLPHVTLVVSGATLGFNNGDTREVCRVLKIDDARRAPRVSISNIAGVDSGTSLPELRWNVQHLWRYLRNAPTIQPHVVCGSTMDEVYPRIRALFDDAKSSNGIIENVICQVSEVSIPTALPTDYPLPAEFKDRPQEWLNELVSWWQQPDSKLLDRLNFTHGSRIYRYGGHREGAHPEMNQLQRAVELLAKDEESGRAIISLLEPGIDLDEGLTRKFPAFCSVQFVLKRQSGGLRLACVAYFRKQEMRYWWPVNLAELAQLQAEAMKELRLQDEKYRNVKAGDITTVAALAHLGDSLPRVAIPRVDRLLDRSLGELWSMVYALCTPALPDRRNWGARWNEVLSDLIPATEPDRDGVPIARHGLRYVLEHLSYFTQHIRDPRLEDVKGSLKQLLDLNERYADDTADGVMKRDRHAKWRADVEPYVERLRQLIGQLFAEANLGHG